MNRGIGERAWFRSGALQSAICGAAITDGGLTTAATKSCRASHRSRRDRQRCRKALPLDLASPKSLHPKKEPS